MERYSLTHDVKRYVGHGSASEVGMANADAVAQLPRHFEPTRTSYITSSMVELIEAEWRIYESPTWASLVQIISCHYLNQCRSLCHGVNVLMQLNWGAIQSKWIVYSPRCFGWFTVHRRRLQFVWVAGWYIVHPAPLSLTKTHISKREFPSKYGGFFDIVPSVCGWYTHPIHMLKSLKKMKK